MKIKVKIVLFMAVTLFLTTACNENEEATQPEIGLIESFMDTAIPQDMGGMKYGSLTLPKGTTSTISEGGSRLSVQLPEGIVYIAMVNNKPSVATLGGYTCTSKCSDGCDVVKLDENVGCSSCSEGSTDPCSGKWESGSFMIGDGEGGGFVDLRQGVSFVKRSNPVDRLDGPDWDVLLSHPEVAGAFDNFFLSLWPEGAPNHENSKLAVVSVFGSYVRLYVPNDLSQHVNASEMILEADVTCECSSGVSGCTHETIKKLGIKVGDKCVAGACTSCTMKW